MLRTLIFFRLVIYQQSRQHGRLNIEADPEETNENTQDTQNSIS